MDAMASEITGVSLVYSTFIQSGDVIMSVLGHVLDDLFTHCSSNQDFDKICWETGLTT